MAYEKKDNYPIRRKPGVYPSGSDKQIGLNNDELEKFSLGSWQEFNLDSSKIDISPDIDYNENNITDVVTDNDSNLNDNLFGFAFTVDSNFNITPENQLDIHTLNNASDFNMLHYYNRFDEPDKYNKTSYPVRVKLGVDHIDTNHPNFNNDITDLSAITDFTTWLNSEFDESTINNNILNASELQSFDDNTLNGSYEENGQQQSFTLRYSGRSTVDFNGNYNIIYNFDKESDTSSYVEGIFPFLSLYQAIERPSVQFVIVFDSPQNKDVKVMDLVKIGSYDYRFKVVKVKGNDNGITEIYLDKFYLGAGVYNSENLTFSVDRKNTNNPAADIPPFDSVYDKYEYSNALTDDEILSTGGYLQPKYVAREGGTGYDSGNRDGDGTPEVIIGGDWDAYQRNPLDGTAPIGSQNLLWRYQGNANANIVTVRSKMASSMMFGNPSSGNGSLEAKFPNIESSVGLQQPPINYNDDGSPLFAQPGNEDDLLTMPLWPGEGNNLWDTGRSNSHWNTPYNQNRTFFNMTRNAPQGFTTEEGWRADAEQYYHVDGDGQDRVSGPHGIEVNDVKLPIVETKDVLGKQKLQITMYNDTTLQIYGKNALKDFPRQGYYRIVLTDILMNAQNSSGLTFNDVSLKLRVNLRERIGGADPVDIVDPYSKEYNINDGNVFNAGNVGVYTTDKIYSGIFAVSPDEDGTGGQVDLDVILNVTLDNFRHTSDFLNLTANVKLSFGGIQYEEVNIDALQQLGSESLPNNSLYKYKVLQWGDEKKLFTDGDILNSFYFKWYGNPSLNLWEIKKYLKSYHDEAKYIKTNGQVNLSEHIYTTPGTKNIKIIVFRTNQFQTHVFETKLITTNIVINDGLLASQDFQIFGGTDFKFLPLRNSNIATINGIDKDSKYHDSVEQILKDDTFVEEDYLERSSTKDFLNSSNDNLFGENIQSLDLSLTRMFTKPIDIYYFIGAGDSEKREEIRQNNFQLNDINLPINSSATDIFIDRQDCVIDINPNKIEYRTIENKKVASDKAILIGDYKLNQPKEGRIQKQGNMKTPSVEKNRNKQAF